MALQFPIEPGEPGGSGGEGTPTPPPSPTPSPPPPPTPSPPPPPEPPYVPAAPISAQVPLADVTVRSLQVPLAAVPSQTVNITLDQQSCTIHVYQKSTGLYFDLAVEDAPIVTGVLCLDRNRLVREPYRAFLGDLTFVDTQGRDDPTFAGLATRFVLVWFVEQ